MSAAWALQTAVKAALAADAGLILLAGDPVRIFDAVPAGAARPNIHFVEWRTDEDDSDDLRLDRHTFTLRVSSEHQGVKEVKAIAAQIEAALHGSALALSGYVLVDLAFIGEIFGREEAAGLAFGEVRFRALTQAE
jgi:hypothetical protein